MSGEAQWDVTDRRRFLAFAGTAVAAAGIPLLSRSAPIPAPALAPVSGIPAAAAPDLTKPRLFPRALAALDNHADRIVHRDRVGVVDFAEGSAVPRFHVVDMAGGAVTTHLVAHGSGSDPDHSGYLQHFSNQPDSNASSRGAFLTGEEYVGKHGRSRRLVGLDPDNHLAESRAIVIHGAAYVSEAMAAAQGRIGRSQGCFAFAEDVIGEILEQLGPGRLIFAWK